jgi:hypothetical protein
MRNILAGVCRCPGGIGGSRAYAIPHLIPAISPLSCLIPPITAMATATTDRSTNQPSNKSKNRHPHYQRVLSCRLADISRSIDTSFIGPGRRGSHLLCRRAYSFLCGAIYALTASSIRRPITHVSVSAWVSRVPWLSGTTQTIAVGFLLSEPPFTFQRRCWHPPDCIWRLRSDDDRALYLTGAKGVVAYCQCG